MLSRRNIRIKVLQSLYAGNQDPQMTEENVEALYDSLIERFFEAFLFTVYVVEQVSKSAHKDLANRKAKYLPTKEDKLFSTKLHDNELIQSLLESKLYDSSLKKYNFSSKADQEQFATLYKEFVSRDAYKKYLFSSSSTKDHREILLELFRALREQDLFTDLIQSHYPNWSDDKSLIVGGVKKVIKALPEISAVEEFFKEDPETVDKLGRILLNETLNNSEQYKENIKRLLENWELERLAVIDTLLLLMAITEQEKLPGIPDSVTINEYVEISKRYSTPKSKEFINAILDRIFKEGFQPSENEVHRVEKAPQLEELDIEKVVVLDFGSQYTQLIARKVREAGVFCEIFPFDSKPSDWGEGVKAVILSGSPYSAKDKDSPQIALDTILEQYPVLAICYGAQFAALSYGGEIEKATTREFGRATLVHSNNDPLLQGISSGSQVWMSHGDTIRKLPEKMKILASTEDVEVAAYKLTDHVPPMYGLQFHPEVSHTLDGNKLLSNFLHNIAGCGSEWTPAHFIDERVKWIREKVGEEKVLLGLSGGVDSSVVALLMQKAIGDQLHGYFIDNGLLREGEFEEVLQAYKSAGVKVEGVNAKKEFLTALKGVTEPEEKRKRIGRVFIEVFDKLAEKDNIKWLAQGTIYPDVIESVSAGGPSATIKSHHNVGGLPDKLNLKIIEPLRMLFKDEVRKVGEELGLPSSFIKRHPFPGPGLAIRIIGEVTPERLEHLKKADKIFIDSLKKWELYDKVWQSGVILLSIKSVGVMGDERTYENPVILRAVTSQDGMTAEWARLPDEFLAEVSSKIINQVKGINRVAYDISTKPPATIEWE